MVLPAPPPTSQRRTPRLTRATNPRHVCLAPTCAEWLGVTALLVWMLAEFPTATAAAVRTDAVGCLGFLLPCRVRGGCFYVLLLFLTCIHLLKHKFIICVCVCVRAVITKKASPTVTEPAAWMLVESSTATAKAAWTDATFPTATARAAWTPATFLSETTQAAQTTAVSMRF